MDWAESSRALPSPSAATAIAGEGYSMVRYSSVSYANMMEERGGQILRFGLVRVRVCVCVYVCVRMCFFHVLGLCVCMCVGSMPCVSGWVLVLRQAVHEYSYVLADSRSGLLACHVWRKGGAWARSMEVETGRI